MAAAETTTTSRAQPASSLNLLHLPGNCSTIDGKLFVISTVVDSSKDLLVYDPQSNSWTEEAPPPTVTNPDDGVNVWITVNSACAHKNRLVVFLSSGRAFERANDGSWSPLEFAAALSDDDLVESVILG